MPWIVLILTRDVVKSGTVWTVSVPVDMAMVENFPERVESPEKDLVRESEKDPEVQVGPGNRGLMQAIYVELNAF